MEGPSGQELCQPSFAYTKVGLQTLDMSSHAMTLYGTRLCSRAKQGPEEHMGERGRQPVHTDDDMINDMMCLACFKKTNCHSDEDSTQQEY